MERKFEIKPEFKSLAIEALSKLSFSQVHAVVNLIKREGNVYTEGESNAIVGFLGEMTYRDVAHLFDAMPKMIVEVADTEADGPVAEPAIAEAVNS